MDALPTWKNKNKIGLEPVSGCLVCGMEVEDNFHPFLRCQLGRDLYKAMAKVWKLPAIESFMPTGRNGSFMLWIPYARLIEVKCCSSFGEAGMFVMN